MEVGRLKYAVGRFLIYNDSSGELQANVSFTRSFTYTEGGIPAFPLEIVGSVVIITVMVIALKFAKGFKKARKSLDISRTWG